MRTLSGHVVKRTDNVKLLNTRKDHRKDQEWKIIRAGKYVDTVFYDVDCSAQYVIAAEGCEEVIKVGAK